MGQFRVWGGVVEIGDVDELFGLGLDSGHDFRVGITEGIDGDARHPVGVGVTVAVVQGHALPVRQDEGRAVVGVDDVLLFGVDDGLWVQDFFRS